MKTKILVLIIGILLWIVLQWYFIFKTLLIEKSKVDDKTKLIVENYKKQEQLVKNEIEEYQSSLKVIIKNKEIEEKRQIKKIVEIEVYNKFPIINKLNDWITYWRVWKSPKIKDRITNILKDKKYIIFKYTLKKVKDNKIIDKEEYTLNCFIKLDENKLWNYYKIYSLDKLNNKYKDFYCLKDNNKTSDEINNKINEIVKFITDTKYYRDVIINYNENIVDDNNINIYYDNYKKIDWYLDKYFKE